MSKISLSPNASGTGTFTIASPNSSTDRTLTLPDQTGTVLTGSGAIGVNASAPTSSVNIDSSGNVGIGTTSPTQKLSVNSSATNVNSLISFKQADTEYMQVGMGADNNAYLLTTSRPMLFYLNGAERMRIDSSGNVLVGATSQSGNAEKFRVTQSTAGNQLCYFEQSSATPYGPYIQYTGASPNGTANNFLQCNDSTAKRFEVRSNGGIGNFSANNVNLSDERLKTDILPATTYLDKICSIPVVTFKYKDQTDDELNLGVIAQEVQKVAPELVDHSGFSEAPEGESPYLAIYQTDLQYALMKCIQEQQTIIETLKADIAELKAKVNV